MSSATFRARASLGRSPTASQPAAHTQSATRGPAARQSRTGGW
jgi:hypothetical protein